VHLKSPREDTQEAWAWDDRLTLEINGSHPCLCAMHIEKVDVPTVFILGDSTVCDQSREPWGSWGQYITRFFKPDVAVSNNAESGETLRSSTGAHRLEKVLSVMKAGDYLLIQYGHNDMKSRDKNAPQQYKALLTDWVKQVKAKGGTPVVITPMNRYSFQDGAIVNSLAEYPEMVREVAREQDVPLIDLNAMSKVLYDTLGEEDAKQLFEHNADMSKMDHTHHSPYGAYELAKCVIEGIRQDKLPLAEHIVEDDKSFDPAHPDAVGDVALKPSPLFSNERPIGIDQQ
jgi:lysophospholipase L1-like esterase